MSRLSDITIDVTDDMLSILLTFQIPWHQLNSFTIRGLKQFQIPDIICALRACTSLILLDLRMVDEPPPEVSQETIKDTVTLFTPTDVVLAGYVPHALIASPVVWAALQSLDTENAPLELQVFSCIIRQCKKLTSLRCFVVNEGRISGASSIPLPHLTFLRLGVENASAFPMLEAPSLSTLEVFASEGSELLPCITSFITRSRMRVRAFSCSLDHAVLLETPSESLRALLFALEGSASVEIWRFIWPQDVLDELASGSLLPCAEVLGVSASSFDVFLAMVKRRLQQTTGLYQIGGSMPETIEDFSDMKSRLHQVEEAHNI
ncbi:hypothetical protein DXG01_003523, partial [Tephrocybe rancida]